ncbi:hypothetical protein NQZ68_020965 [Dissostichus eleginoides]|nr:hypothetical protein NQZ68_020965 [Dissostichus eleginoides]
MASVHHRAGLSGLCWRHGLSRRTLIGSTGDEELEVDEGKDYGRDSCTAMPSIAINPYGQQPFTAFSDWSH